MKKYSVLVLIGAVIFLIGSILPAYGQDVPGIRTKVPLYIDVNKAKESDVFFVSDNFMSIQFEDQTGDQSGVVMEVYNWKMELEETFELDKNQGMNHYSLQLDEVGLDLAKHELLHCVLKGTNREIYRWSVRPAIKPEFEKIIPSINVKTISIDCSERRQESVIEYYGDAKGGRAPYVLNWYVLNEAGSKLLYQPKETNTESPDELAMITVDKPLSYQVLLHVTDACGATAEKMVTVTCQNKKKKINTIFVDPYPIPDQTKKTVRFN